MDESNARKKTIVIMKPLSLALFTVGAAACARMDRSGELKITNGSETGGYATVAKVFRHDKGAEVDILCTGTFIRSDKLLTAAHCGGVDANPSFTVEWNNNGEVFSQTVSSSGFVKHPDYEMGSNVHPNDLAVISLGDSMVASEVQDVSFEPSKRGDEVVLVGYGDNLNFLDERKPTGSGQGIKRYGKNTIYTIIRKGFIVVSGYSGCENKPSGTESVSGDGDSGSPLISQNSVVGVASGGGIVAEEGKDCFRSISYFSDLSIISNQKFIKENLL